MLVGGGPNLISRLNSDGSVDTFNFLGIGLAGGVSAASLDGSGNIIAGGFITAYNGTERSNLIRLFPNGSLDPNFNPTVSGTIASGSVNSTAIQSDGKILIAGFFDTVNGVARDGLARLNSDGTLDTAFAPIVPFAGAVSKIVLQPDQRVIVGGQFTTIAGAPRNRIARLNSNATIDPSYSRKRGPNDSVFSIPPLSSGKVLIGGIFETVDEAPSSGIARLNSDARLDTSFSVGSGFQGSVGKVALQQDGKILAGGFFTLYNGTPRQNIARLNDNGSLDPSFDAGTAVDGVITDIEIQTDGKIVIVGLFASVGGLPGRHIARLNANGSLDSGFNPGTGADFEIYDVEMQPNGQILIGGNFDNFNGTPRSSVARLNSSGGLDFSFNVSTQFDSAILSLASQPDGRIVVGGAFNNVNGLQRNHLARLNTNGAEDTSFLLTGGFETGAVYKVALQSDGKILAGGTFFSLGNNFSRVRLGRLLPSGTVDTTFQVSGISGGSNNESEVDDIAIQSNGKILFAGEFTVVDSVEANRISRLIGTFVALEDTPFDYDGDGRADLSVRRPADNNWYVLRGTAGYHGMSLACRAI